jgi:hypothetical protein
MIGDQRWNQFIDDVWLRGGRALLLAGAVVLLGWTQQHFDYPIWKLGVAAFVMALPHRTFPLIVLVLLVLSLLALFPPSSVSAFVDFIMRLRG